MPSIIDRLNRELETIGKRAQAALDEGKYQIELLRLKRQRDTVARDLGMLIYRRERGGDIDHLEIDALLVRLDKLGESIAKVEREIASVKAEKVSVSTQPVPASAAPTESEVVTGDRQRASPT